MILNQSEYNPIKDILELIPGKETVLTIPLMHDIRRKLFKGGACCETDEEFEQCLEILRDLSIVELERLKDGRILIKRGTNGKI